MSRKERQPLADYEPRRIVIIKPSALGDIVHALPVLTAVRQRFPNAYIGWVVNRAYEPLLRGHPDLDATMPFDRGASKAGILRGVATYVGFLRRLRRERFDLVLDLQGLFRSGVMTLATGAARRVGLSTAREAATAFYTDVVRCVDFNAMHAVDRLWLVAAALGGGGGPKQFRLPVQESARQWVRETLHDCPRPWLALAVGSRWLTKRWPPSHFAELARRAQKLAGGTVLFVGSPEDAPLAVATAAQLNGPFRDVVGTTTLPQLAALLAEADLMLANDTGPLHMAVALGRPVVAPYTCTKVLLNGPYGAERGAVETRVACQGSYLKRCSRMECMTELTPDRLWPALEEVLRQWQRRSLSA
jgi:heptosyltransferase-1